MMTGSGPVTWDIARKVAFPSGCPLVVPLTVEVSCPSSLVPSGPFPPPLSAMVRSAAADCARPDVIPAR